MLPFVKASTLDNTMMMMAESSVPGHMNLPQHYELPAERGLQGSFLPAFQSSADIGPNYAGGMVLDPQTNKIYITGATYGSFFESTTDGGPREKSDCFFASLSWPALMLEEGSAHGSTSTPEACNSLAVSTTSAGTSSIVVGSSEGGKFLSEHMTAKQSAFAMNLLASDDGEFGMGSGLVLEHGAIQYPISVVMDSSGENSWIVSMFSEKDSIRADMEKTLSNDHPNLTTGGIEKYGSKYRIRLEKIKTTEAADKNGERQQNLQSVWDKNFADSDSVFVSDILFADDNQKLVIVGSSSKGIGGASIWPTKLELPMTEEFSSPG